MSSDTDNVVPFGRWTFDEEVADAFDNMLERSIPQYEVMRDTATDLAVRFANQAAGRPETRIVVDLGCSRGEALWRVARALGERARYIGLDASEPMLDHARARFRNFPDGAAQILRHDLREGLPVAVPYAAAFLSVLTIQFTPIEHRQRILTECYTRLLDGGALILVEKVLGSDDAVNRALVAEHEALKLRNGYRQEDVDRKRMSLEGVLVPVTAAWNEELLRQAGFRSVDCFWRCLNFAGWVAVR